MKTRTLTPALALVAAVVAVALFILMTESTVAASSTPDSQAAICQTALDKLTSSEQSVNGDYRLGRLHPLFFLGIGGRPDEWVLEYERRVNLFKLAFEHAAASCPHFAPFTGPLPGHL
jgi:hypothetical protein